MDDSPAGLCPPGRKYHSTRLYGPRYPYNTLPASVPGAACASFTGLCQVCAVFYLSIIDRLRPCFTALPQCLRS